MSSSFKRISVFAPAGEVLFEGWSALDDEANGAADPARTSGAAAREVRGDALDEGDGLTDLEELEDPYDQCPPTQRSPTSSGIYAVATPIHVEEVAPSTLDPKDGRAA
jgi:hypothetical protein